MGHGVDMSAKVCQQITQYSLNSKCHPLGENPEDKQIVNMPFP